jgi:hypothetical protein
MKSKLIIGAFLVGCLPLFVGCTSKKTPDKPNADKHDHDNGHAHPHGPHDGELFSVEDGKYHLEAVADKSSDKVTVYVLDGEAKEPAMADRKVAKLHVVLHEADHDFEFEPTPQKDDPDGKTSQFELEDEELHLAVKDAELKGAKLHVSFDGNELVGEFEEHEHGSQGHKHAEDDALVYRQKGIEQDDCTIELGQHGFVIHAGEELEPAVSVVRDGKPVPDAKVFVALIADDGEKVLAEETATEFEKETAEEPAHYAGAHLDVPADAKRVIVRYRIVLPGAGGSKTYDSALIDTEQEEEKD